MLSDLRTENVLINKDNGDLAALIDWQVGSSDASLVKMS